MNQRPQPALDQPSGRQTTDVSSPLVAMKFARSALAAEPATRDWISSLVSQGNWTDRESCTDSVIRVTLDWASTSPASLLRLLPLRLRTPAWPHMTHQGVDSD